MSRGGRITTEFIDVHKVELGVPGHAAHSQASHPAKAVDPDAGDHLVSPVRLLTHESSSTE